MPGIFISYRSADAQGFAGRLADDLTQRFGDALVFRDDELVPGTAYPDAIREQLHACDALIAVIGPNWLGPASTQGQSRLFNADDWVRREIEVALNRDAYVVPVLVADADLPSATSLPQSMHALTLRQTFVLSDDGWHDDVDKLAALLAERVPQLRNISAQTPSPPAIGDLIEDVLDQVASRLPEETTGHHPQPRRGLWRSMISACLKGLKSLIGLMLLALFAYFLVTEYGDEQTKDFVHRLQRFVVKLASQGLQVLKQLFASSAG